MNVNQITTGAICVGDYIVYGCETRLIIGFEYYDNVDGAALFDDGGIMGLDEIKSDMIRLESEVIF